jgi:hypothetical protein
MENIIKTELKKKILKIFNRNIPLDEEYTIEEIKEAFECNSSN